MNKVLIVAAHPDDEVLGCGGTIARHAKMGDEVYCLILGEGFTSRFSMREQAGLEKVRLLQEQAEAAAKVLGIKQLYFEGLPDNRFDTIALLEIVKKIEQIKSKVSPTIVYTHYSGDLNIDHQITHKATLTACRPLPGDTVREIYSFSVPSSTEWGLGECFTPDVFIDISDTFAKKIAAVQSYQDEVRDFPHPRSLPALEASAKDWGAKVGMPMAEPFKLIRKKI